jgi:hypothetical protein
VDKSTGEIIEAAIEPCEPSEPSPEEETADEAFEKMESASPRANLERQVKQGLIILGYKTKPKITEVLQKWGFPATAAECTDEQLRAIDSKINEMVNLR